MTNQILPEQLWLGAFVGAQLILVFFCVIKANAYRERALLLHGAATLMAVLVVLVQIGDHALLPPAVLLLVPALAGLQLMELTIHGGRIGGLRRWLLAVSGLALPLLAAGAIYSEWSMVAGIALWTFVVVLLLLRVWRRSRPWIWWLVPGVAALVAASLVLAVDAPPYTIGDALLLSALLTAWSACTYLATGWRGRIFSETRARMKARTTVDPLTGLATPMVLEQRIVAASHMLRRYGHPSVMMLVHLENLPTLVQEFGPETAESALLAAASRVRDALLRDGDVAARVGHARIGVLAEGAAAGEAAATVATRILVAGLKEPLAEARAEYLRFRIVLAAVPAADIGPVELLQRLHARMDQELRLGSERRIVTLGLEEWTAVSP